MKYLLNKVKSSEFTRNVLTLFSGTAIAQVIPLIVAPLLSRIYVPDDYGLLALFIAISGLFTSIATLQYESAIILPKKNEDALNLVALSIAILTAVSFISLIAVIVFNEQITEKLGNSSLSLWLYFIPISIFLSGVFNILTYWSSRGKEYKRLAFRTVSRSGTTAGTKLAFGIIGATNSGLIIGTLFGQFTSTSVLAWLSFKDVSPLLSSISRKEILHNARRYIDFPKYSTWHGFLDILNTSGVSLIVSYFFGSSILGLYAFALGLIQKPIRLIGNAITQVYYQRISEDYNQGKDVWPLTRKILIRLLQIGIIIFIPIAISGPTIFSFIFGDEWNQAGIYARIITPWILVRFIGSPITSIIKILNKQKEFFLNILIYNISTPLIFITLAKIGFEFDSILIVSSIFSACYLTWLILWIRSITKAVTNE